MRFLRLSACGLAIAVLGFSALSASADVFHVTLPSSAVSSNPGCGVFDVSCSVVLAGNLAGGLGTFDINELGDLNNVQPTPTPNGVCMPLAGSTLLTLGGGSDVLALVSKSTADTLCVTQPADALGFPVPATGPWPLVLTLAVDPAASSGIYAGATGTGQLDGTWIPLTSCLDAQGNPIQLCGFSGESLAFTFTGVSIPNLTLVSDGGCTTNCGGGGNPNPGATPELDSLTLFGSALVSMAGYIGLRRRARRARR